MRKVDVRQFQRKQFTAAQSPIVGHEHHELIAERLITQSKVQKYLPLPVTWDPRRALISGNERPLAQATEPVRSRIPSPTDWIRIANTCFHEKVIEETNRGEALLNGFVRQS